MGNALFYHLTRSDAETLLPRLIGRAMDAGWRVELRAPARARLEALDQALWLGEGFLAHGLAGGQHDARQPVLLRAADAPPAGNSPDCLMLVDGAELTADEALALNRSFIIFDGNHPPAVDRAREQWRLLSGGGITMEYWTEDGDGRWQKKR